MRKEEGEREEKRAEREDKLRREEAEQRRWEADREERQRKELVEDERRQTEMQQQAELFAQRQRELDRQTARDRVEEARRDSAVLKGKLFGDAMRASVIRMGVDPIEAIPFQTNIRWCVADCAISCTVVGNCFCHFVVCTSNNGSIATGVWPAACVIYLASSSVNVFVNSHVQQSSIASY